MKYRTIVADPPWDYGRNESVSFTHGGTGPRLLKPFTYPSMGGDAIAAIPVAGVAEADSRLFLWATNRHLPLAFHVVRAWGFRYKQTLVWKKTGNPSPFGGSVAPNHARTTWNASGR